jgi:hypothetical protein
MGLRRAPTVIPSIGVESVLEILLGGKKQGLSLAYLCCPAKTWPSALLTLATLQLPGCAFCRKARPLGCTAWGASLMLSSDLPTPHGLSRSSA